MDKFILSDSLLMCSTPLQMLIADRIIDLYPNQHFDLLVIALNDNEKFRYYYDVLKSRCNNSMYYPSTPGIIGFAKFYQLLRKASLCKKYKYLYLASIDSRYYQYIVSKNSNAVVFTFDDGTANIIKNSILYQNNEPSVIKGLVWNILGIKYYMEDIKEKSSLHYTIYKNIPNIVNKTSFINISSKPDSTNDKITSSVSFLLGQPLYELGIQDDVKLITRVINELDISFYFPHPREKEFDLSIPRINDILVFEDFIVKFLNANPTADVLVYSFVSSASLNVSDLPRVSSTLLKNTFLEEKYKEFYDFAEKSLGLKVLYV